MVNITDVYHTSPHISSQFYQTSGTWLFPWINTINAHALSLKMPPFHELRYLQLIYLLNQQNRFDEYKQ